MNRKKAQPPVVATLSGAELSAATGLSDRRHRQLAEQKIIPGPTRGRWPAIATLGAMVQHYRQQIERPGAALAAARLRRAGAQARSAEVQANKDEESVVDLDEARHVFARCAADVKTRLLSVPSAISPRLVGLNITEMDERIRDAILDALGALDRARLGNVPAMPESPAEKTR